jgi:signal transduction histidine kinase
MSASPQPAARMLQDHEILGELLHSVSQPLTSLCCSLELSVEKAAGQQQEAVAAALEQAERVIGQVRLLREYLDAELAGPTAPPIAFAPVLRDVVEQMSSIASVQKIELKIVGTSSATLGASVGRLRQALQYLMEALIDGQRDGDTITLRLRENAAESLLSAHIKGQPPSPEGRSSRDQEDAAMPTSRKVKLAIALRVLESAGASLTISQESPCDFLLHIPLPSARPV